MGRNAIIFTGPASSGKSSAAKEIAKRFGLKFYAGGDILKMLAKDMGYDPNRKDWWDTKEGMEFFAMRKEDPSFDHKVDAKLEEILDKGNCAITSSTMSWLYNGDAVRIWLSASVNERSRRMAVRDGIELEKAKEIVKKRDEINKRYFKKIYKIDLGKDFKPFDIVLDSSKLTQKETAAELTKRIQVLLKRVPKLV